MALTSGSAGEIIFLQYIRPYPERLNVFSQQREGTMLSKDAFFKIRPTKRSNPESRTTLDCLHQYHVQSILSNRSELTDSKTRLERLDKEMFSTEDEIRHEQLRKERNEQQKGIERRTGNSEMFDYFLDTGDILYEYYEIQEKIQKGAEASVRRPTKAKQGSVLAALESAAATEGIPEPTYAPQTQGALLSRDKLLEQYLQKVHPEHARSSAVTETDSYGECPECDKEMVFSANEAIFTCTECGFQQFILIDSDKPSYKDPPREVSYYAYKRINHFNEWLAQFQAKESTEIPQEVYEAICTELKKERILDYRTLSRQKVREILKKLKFNKYYEHVPHIINRLNGCSAPVMSREVEEKLRYMFKEIQPSFQKNCPKDRSNFLSYSYVLYKFCELLDLDEYLPSFPLLKNRDKLYIQDKIWELICRDLQWQFIRSV